MGIKSFNSIDAVDRNLSKVPKKLRSDYIRDSIIKNSPLEYTKREIEKLKRLI